MNSNESKATQIKKRPTTTRKWTKLIRRAIRGHKNSAVDTQFSIGCRKFKAKRKEGRCSIVGEDIDQTNACTCGLSYFDRSDIRCPVLNPWCHSPYPILPACYCYCTPIDWCRCHPVLDQANEREVLTQGDSKSSHSQHVRQMDCEIKNSTLKDALLSTAILNDMGANFDNEVEVQRQLCQHRNEVSL